MHSAIILFHRHLWECMRPFFCRSLEPCDKWKEDVNVNSTHWLFQHLLRTFIIVINEWCMTLQEFADAPLIIWCLTIGYGFMKVTGSEVYVCFYTWVGKELLCHTAGCSATGIFLFRTFWIRKWGTFEIAITNLCRMFIFDVVSFDVHELYRDDTNMSMNLCFWPEPLPPALNIIRNECSAKTRENIFIYEKQPPILVQFENRWAKTDTRTCDRRKKNATSERCVYICPVRAMYYALGWMMIATQRKMYICMHAYRWTLTKIGILHTLPARHSWQRKNERRERRRIKQTVEHAIISIREEKKTKHQTNFRQRKSNIFFPPFIHYYYMMNYISSK